MKRVWIASLLCIMLLLCSCEKPKTLADAQGVWLMGDSDYYIVEQWKVSRIPKEVIVQLYVDTMEQTLLEYGKTAFWKLTPADMPMTFQPEIVATDTQVRKLELDVGTLSAQDGTLTLTANEQSQRLTKVSDTAALSSEWLHTIFDQCKQSLVMQADQLLPTVEEYREFLQQKNPEMKDWSQVERDDGIYMISSSGRELLHEGALTVTQTSLAYSTGWTKTGVGDFYLEYNGTQLVVRSTYFTALQDIVAYAAPVLEAIPSNIDCQQLMAIYQAQRVGNLDQSYSFTYTEDGVQYAITRTASGGKTELKISLPAEMTVQATPAERTEAPYITGFHTDAFANLQNGKRYYTGYYYSGSTVSNYLRFEADGMFYFTMYYAGYSDSFVGEYTTDGDQITIYYEALTLFGEGVHNGTLNRSVFQYDGSKNALILVDGDGLSWQHAYGREYPLRALND